MKSKSKYILFLMFVIATGTATVEGIHRPSTGARVLGGLGAALSGAADPYPYYGPVYDPYYSPVYDPYYSPVFSPVPVWGSRWGRGGWRGHRHRGFRR